MDKQRSFEKELIDLGPDNYSKEEYEDCLFKLDRVGRWLGGDWATFSSLKNMQPPPESILDVGCGSGLFTIKLADRYPQTRIVGIDLNSLAIQFAKQQLALQVLLKNISFECRTEEKLHEPSKSYDVVIATLVCHHLTDEQFIEFISSACRIAKKKVIINDLQRHPFALFLFKMISPIFFRNRLVQHDGPLSIERAFKHLELVQLLEQAGIDRSLYRIKWHWAFRWILEIDCTDV